MRADDRADDVVRVRTDGHPVAHRLVDGVAERPRTARHGAHLGAQRPHDEDVELLPADVFLAHVDDAGQPEEGAGGGGGDAVLAGAGLGDDARFLPIRSVSSAWPMVLLILCAGVVEVFALEVDVRPAAVLREALGKIQRAWPADRRFSNCSRSA